jgi:hypothetical protein
MGTYHTYQFVGIAGMSHLEKLGTRETNNYHHPHRGVTSTPPSDVHILYRNIEYIALLVFTIQHTTLRDTFSSRLHLWPLDS